MADRYLLESGAPDGYLLEDGSGVLLLEVAPPVITSAATANVQENYQLAHSLTADESVTWSLVGGADQSHFELSGSTLRWASNGHQDFEDPLDFGANNTYVVTVRATSVGSGLTTDQTFTATVTNIGTGPATDWEPTGTPSVAVASGDEVTVGSLNKGSGLAIQPYELVLSDDDGGRFELTSTGELDVDTYFVKTTGVALVSGARTITVWDRSSDRQDVLNITVTGGGPYKYKGSRTSAQLYLGTRTEAQLNLGSEDLWA